MRKRLKAVPADARPGPALPEMLGNVLDRSIKAGCKLSASQRLAPHRMAKPSKCAKRLAGIN
jgi:hypothetical protein